MILCVAANPSIGGRVVLTVTLTPSGMVQLRTQASDGSLAPVERCMLQAFQTMHGNPGTGTFNVAFSFSPR